VENASPVGNGRTSLVRPVAREALVAVAVAAVIAILGAPLGLLWHYVAPTVELVKTSSGWYPMAAEPEGFVADDGWFVVIGVGAGVVVAVGAWLLLRSWRGPAILAAVAVGSFACAALAGWVGHRIGLTEYQRLVRDAVVGTKIQRLPGTAHRRGQAGAAAGRGRGVHPFSPRSTTHRRCATTIRVRRPPGPGARPRRRCGQFGPAGVDRSVNSTGIARTLAKSDSSRCSSSCSARSRLSVSGSASSR